MSTCWKCGRDLPEGQVECEDVCRPPKLPTFAEAAALNEPSIAGELDRGIAAALLVAKHLEEMDAATARMEVELNGVKYLVFVKRL